MGLKVVSTQNSKRNFLTQLSNNLVFDEFETLLTSLSSGLWRSEG